jgi:hypothetical protein
MADKNVKFIRKNGKVIPVRGKPGQPQQSTGHKIAKAITAVGAATAAVGYSKMAKSIGEGFKNVGHAANLRAILKRVPANGEAKVGLHAAVAAGKAAVDKARKARKVGRAGVAIAAAGAVGMMATKNRNDNKSGV